MRNRFKTLIPVSNDGMTVLNAGINLPWPMTEEEWTQFLTVLDAMKPGLVWPIGKEPDDA